MVMDIYPVLYGFAVHASPLDAIPMVVGRLVVCDGSYASRSNLCDVVERNDSRILYITIENHFHLYI